MRIEVVGPDQVPDRVAVQRASFDKSTFTDERWHAMAAGLPYAGCEVPARVRRPGQCSGRGDGVVGGSREAGLVEPMGAHSEHRGHGYGRAITIAGAAALQDLGSSSAVVYTRSSNVGGVATYKSAGFQQLSEIRDLYRDA